ncbi:hypothetical protein D3C75_1040190 [compost metagenome]
MFHRHIGQLREQLAQHLAKQRLDHLGIAAAHDAATAEQQAVVGGEPVVAHLLLSLQHRHIMLEHRTGQCLVQRRGGDHAAV